MYLLGHTILYLRWVIGIVNPSSRYPMLAMADTYISQLLLLNLDISRSYITRWRAQCSSYNDIKPVSLCTHGWHRPNMRAMGCLSRALQKKKWPGYIEGVLYYGATAIGAIRPPLGLPVSNVFSLTGELLGVLRVLQGKVTAIYREFTAQIAKFIGSTWGPPGSWRPQVGPMLAPWTLLSVCFMVQQQSG